MGKVLEAVKGWQKDQGRRVAGAKEVVRYVETGDRAALKRVKPYESEQYYRDYRLKDAIGPPGKLTDEDRRGLHVLGAGRSAKEIGGWLSRALASERPDGDVLEVLRRELAEAGADEGFVPAMIVMYVPTLAGAGRPNSAGRALLALDDAALRDAVEGGLRLASTCGPGDLFPLVEFLLASAPERVSPLLEPLWPSVDDEKLAQLLLKKDPARFEAAVAGRFRAVDDPCQRFRLGKLLTGLDPRRYGPETLEAGRGVLATDHGHVREDAEWMIPRFGEEILEHFIPLPSDDYGKTWQKARLLTPLVRALGRKALPAVLAALRAGGVWNEEEKHIKAWAPAIGNLIDLDDGSHEDLIRSELERELQSEDPGRVVEALDLAGRWRPGALADRLWPLLAHKAKPVRDAAAKALGTLGDEAVLRASGLLADKKAVNRASAVALLEAAGTPSALEALGARLDLEADEDVRDAMLLALDAAGPPGAPPVPPEEVARRIARAKDKLKAPAAPWIHEDVLPPLRYRDGTPLGPEATRYLIYRQTRAREMRADVEARAVVERLDPSSAADFAAELLRQFVASKADPKDRWALALAGLLGDDRVVPVFNGLIPRWADSNRGKMAEYAVQALVLVGSDAALMAIDAIALRYRNKYKNIAASAVEAFEAAGARLGMTTDELGDRVVPTLGFEPGKPRVVEEAGKRIEVGVGRDFKLSYRDLEKGKPLASLPKSLPKETLAEFKDLAATLREVAKAQTPRLENLMVRQHRWPVARWSGLFLDSPVLFPFAQRLVWGHYGEGGTLRATFRALEDRTLSTAEDEAFARPGSGTVGIVHPLELPEEARERWRAHLADYEVTPPFPQLERPVALVPEDRRPETLLKDARGRTLSALTFKGRAERLGWVRGPVLGNGSVYAYAKRFPSGVEAVLALENMSVQPFPDQETTLSDVGFFRTGEWDGGYDPLPDADDPRLIALGDVPPVVYSEVTGDLDRIAGPSAEGDAD